LLVVHSKRRPTAGLKLLVGRHIEQQERRENQRRTKVSGGSGGFRRAGGEVQFEARLLAAWRVWGGMLKMVGPIVGWGVGQKVTPQNFQLVRSPHPFLWRQIRTVWASTKIENL
jgi:hypothetical protein